MRSRKTLAGLGVALLAIAAGSCSINGSRSLGDDCLQNRECASGLSCQPRADGRFTCQPVVDGSIFTGVDAVTVDVSSDGANADASAQDASAD